MGVVTLVGVGMREWVWLHWHESGHRSGCGHGHRSGCGRLWNGNVSGCGHKSGRGH